MPEPTRERYGDNAALGGAPLATAAPTQSAPADGAPASEAPATATAPADDAAATEAEPASETEGGSA